MPRVVRVTLSAMTRVEWSALVEVPDDMPVREINKLGDTFYEKIDGGEYYDDPEFWDDNPTQVDLDPEQGDASILFHVDTAGVIHEPKELTGETDE